MIKLEQQIADTVTELSKRIKQLECTEHPVVGGPVPAPVTTGDMLVADAVPAWSILSDVAAGQPLLSGGVGVVPAYAGWYLSGTAGQTYTFPPATASLVGGTGVANRVALWSGANTLSSDAGLTYVAATGLNLTLGIATQAQIGFDAGNYFTTSVDAIGFTVFNAVGAGAWFEFRDGVSIVNGAPEQLLLADDVAWTNTAMFNIDDIGGGITRLDIQLGCPGGNDVDIRLAAKTQIWQTGIAGVGVHNLLTINNVSSGVPSDNYGSRILHQLSSDASNSLDAVALDAIYTDVTHATRTANYVISLVNNAVALAEYYRFAPSTFTMTNPTGPATLTTSVAATTGITTLTATGTAPVITFASKTNHTYTQTGITANTVVADNNCGLTLTGNEAFVYEAIRAAPTLDQNGSNATATTGALRGFSCFAKVIGAAGTVTSAIAGLYQVQNTGAGTLTSAFGLRIFDVVNSGGGTINASYGLYINSMATASANYAIVTNAGLIVFNETGNDSDIRFEGDNDTNLFFCDAGNDRVGIGTGTPAVKNHVVSATATTDAILEVMRLEAQVTGAGVGAAGFGPALDMYAESATNTNYRQALRLSSEWTVATDATRNNLFRENTYPSGSAVGYRGLWSGSAIDGSAQTVIANATGDVTECITVVYAVAEITGANTAGGTCVLEPGDSFILISDGTNSLTLACAADGSVTVQRTAGADTYKIVLDMVWL